MQAPQAAAPKFKSVPLVLPSSRSYDPVTGEVQAVRPPPAQDRLVVVDAGLRVLEEIHGKVAVVSIVGLARSGKSYALSRILGSPDAFAIGATQHACTYGLWIGTTTIKRGDYTIVLVDSEGLNHVDGSSKRDHATFVLTILLSSLLIYNSKTVPTSSDLDQLSFVIGIARKLTVRTGGGAASADLKDYFPDFLWLLRDSHLTLTRPTWTEYLIKDVLAQVGDDAPDAESTNLIRKSIGVFFRTVHCHALSYPGSNGQNISRLDRVNFSELHPTFNAQWAEFEALLYKVLTPKLVPMKEALAAAPSPVGKPPPTNLVPATGKLLASFVRVLVDAVSSGTIPPLEPMYVQAMRAALARAADSARVAYRAHLDECCGGAQRTRLPLEASELQRAHEAAVDSVLKVFSAEAPACEEAIASECLGRLLDELARFGGPTEPGAAAPSRTQCSKCNIPLYARSACCPRCCQPAQPPRHADVKARVSILLKPPVSAASATEARRLCNEALRGDASDPELHALCASAAYVLDDFDGATASWALAARHRRSVRGGVLLEYVTANERASENHCKLLLEQLYAPVRDGIGKKVTSLAEFEAEVGRMKAHYDKEARGPAKGDAAAEFFHRVLAVDGDLLRSVAGHRADAAAALLKRSEAEAREAAAEEAARCASEFEIALAKQQVVELKAFIAQAQRQHSDQMAEYRSAMAREQERSQQLLDLLLAHAAQRAQTQACAHVERMAELERRFAEEQERRTTELAKLQTQINARK